MLAVATISSASASAFSDAAGPGTFSITPAVVETTLSPGSPLPPISVANSTPTAFRIRVYPALVRQNLDGSLAIRSQPGELAAARRRFKLTPKRLLLRRDRQATISGRFLAAPARAPEAYAAAVIEAEPLRVRRGGPTYRLRLLGALLVTKPSAPPPRGRITSLRVQQVGPRRLRFVARLRNTGRVHGYPQALRLRVRDGRGRTVFAAAPHPGVVLPRFSRDYSADLFRRLGKGRYTLQVTASFGDRRLHRVVRFRVGATNQLR
jgi:hypothetical protein